MFKNEKFRKHLMPETTFFHVDGSFILVCLDGMSNTIT